MKKTAVFLAVTTEYPVYANYPEVAEAFRNVPIPLLLMTSRWDGHIGFPGGYAEQGETLRDTCIREAYEELGITLSADEIHKLRAVSLHETADKTIVLYTLHVGMDRALEMMHGARYAPHFLSETCGVMLQQVANFNMGNGKVKGYAEFIKNNFAPTAEAQVKDLMRYRGWLDVDQIGEDESLETR